MNYVAEVTKALEALGATVVPPSDWVEPLFDIVSRSIPFEANEGAALKAVIECAEGYYSTVLAVCGVSSGVVIIGPGSEGLEVNGPVVSVRVGMYAQDDNHFCYIGNKDGEVVMVKKLV